MILTEIKKNKFITIPEFSLVIKKSSPTIYRHIKSLSNDGILKRIGSRKNGYWEIIK